MNINSLHDLPDWEDDSESRSSEDAGEEWKSVPTRSACKKMYQHWQQVMTMLNGALESAGLDSEGLFPKAYWEENINMLLGDAVQIAAKIRSSEAGDLYIIRMENACIIRKNAQFIASSILMMAEEKVIDEKHGSVIREEIDAFRELFKQWVATFQKDETEDEWGLFI